MKKNNTYFEEREIKNINDIRLMLTTLPDYCSYFIRAIEPRTTSLTRLGYLRDIRIFLEFLTTNVTAFLKKGIGDITADDLNTVTAMHLEEFLSYLTYYQSNGRYYRNGEKARNRKLSSVRNLFKYLFKNDLLEKNVAEKVDSPKIRESEIIRLEKDEVDELLNMSETGKGLTQMQKGFHKHTKVRDFAIMSLFLGTGIRISELVGLNISDIFLEQNSFKVTRKGGNKVILYYNNEVAEALEVYLEQRKEMKVINKIHENALFLSLQNRRISVRAVENLVKKYSQIISPLKNITPHKLRSTFGTNLYRETNDIYIVADVLGHKDVNTTRKHYAAISEDIRRNAASKVKLRKD